MNKSILKEKLEQLKEIVDSIYTILEDCDPITFEYETPSKEIYVIPPDEYYHLKLLYEWLNSIYTTSSKQVLL